MGDFRKAMVHKINKENQQYFHMLGNKLKNVKNAIPFEEAFAGDENALQLDYGRALIGKPLSKFIKLYDLMGYQLHNVN